MDPSDRSTAAFPRHRPRRRRIPIVWIWTVGLCLAALISTYVMFVEPPPPRRIVIASGARNGAYDHFAQRYAEEVRKEGLLVEVRETAGSVENLRLLGQADSGVSIAFVQSGVADDEQLTQYLALGSLYHEPLWVFYRGAERLERISQLAGRRIGIGPQGSGTNAIATRLLAANGIAEPGPSDPTSRTHLVRQDVAAAAESLRKGELDAAFFVAAFDADYIHELLNDPAVNLLSFSQQQAYHRRYRFLAPVSVPAGLVDLGRNVPARDVVMLAPTAMLVARKDFHPALISLFLVAASRIHSGGDRISEPGEFPSDSYCDFPVSDDARRFYRSGQPVLQRLLPFWVASLADRAKVMLIPLVMLMMPLFRAAPPLMRWRTRRKIYLWYSDLRDIDQRLIAGLTGAEIDHEIARLRRIEHQVAFLDVPLSYMEEFYHLRLHLGMLQHRILEIRASGEPAVASRD